jgi:hypothetical protein
LKCKISNTPTEKMRQKRCQRGEVLTQYKRKTVWKDKIKSWIKTKKCKRNIFPGRSKSHRERNHLNFLLYTKLLSRRLKFVLESKDFRPWGLDDKGDWKAPNYLVRKKIRNPQFKILHHLKRFLLAQKKMLLEAIMMRVPLLILMFQFKK